MLLVLLVVSLAACGLFDEGDVWKEEVRLMNGELLVLDRLNRWGESGDLSLGHGPQTWAEMHWEYRGKQYSWAQRGVMPHALQLDGQGRFYIVSTIPYCWAWRERGEPKSFYVVFRFEDGGWKEIPLTEIDVNTVFNLAATSSPPDTNLRTPYQKETDWKYKDHSVNYMKGIVVNEGAGCY